MNGTELFDSTISVDWAFCHDPSNASYLRWVCFLEITAINVSWIFSSAGCWYVVGPSIGVSFKQGRYAGITLQQRLLVTRLRYFIFVCYPINQYLLCLYFFCQFWFVVDHANNQLIWIKLFSLQPRSKILHSKYEYITAFIFFQP